MTEIRTGAKRPFKQRQGQTLVEFAITLPILLVLLFGIIEFGRIFQAWIAVQNASRVAARYASTGQYDRAFEEYISDDSIELGIDDSNSIVPCESTASPFVAGNEVNLAPYYYDRDQEYAVLAPNGARSAPPNSERLFTMIWNKDCQPQTQRNGVDTASPDQLLRTDLLRIPSIYAAAAEGAGGLSVDPIPVDNIIPSEVTFPDFNDRVARAEERLWYFYSSVWHPKYPQFMLDSAQATMDIAADQPIVNVEQTTFGALDAGAATPDEAIGPVLLNSYFSVMVCSSRAVGPGLENDAEREQMRISTEGRYVTVFSGTEFDPEDYGNPVAGATADQVARAASDRAAAEDLKNLLSEGGELYNRYTDMPGCFLNIERRAGDEWTRWLDAGGPGDRVDVAVSFYHPLLTPLGLAEFLPIHGRRSARVEAFRSASAPVGDPDGSGGGGGLLPSGEEATPEDTDTPTPVTPSSTPTETPTVTPSRIPEEAVFDCANIELVPIDPNEDLSEDDQRIAFQPGRVVFLLRNTNNTPARLRAVDFHWSSPAYDSDSNIDPIPGYPTFFFDRFELDGNAHWDGTDPDPETNTLQEVGEIVSQAFEIPADTSVRWAAIYRSGPTFLNEVIPRSAFTGTSFTVVDPLTGTECPTADLTFTSTTNTVEAESTPVIDPENDCASNTIEFGAVPNAFQDFGWVQLYVTNQRDFPATIQGFEVTWGPWEDRQESGSVRLQGVYVGGSTPPSGVLLWSAQSDDGVGITNLTNYPEDQLGTGPGDLQNEYAPVTEADGVWTGGYSINPNTTETIWLDFNGDNLADDRNMILSDLNNTRLIFDCNGDGGTNGNGGGGNNDGRVTLINQPEPEPTVDRRNDPPVAQDNTFNVNSSSQQFSIGVNQSILNNDSDCFDDTPSRLVVGTPCGSIDNVRDDGTVNGDGVTATVRNNAQTDKGGRISINADGTFTYDPTTLNDDSICTATQVTDTYNYQIVDGRGATSTGLITFNVNITDSPNNRPESTGNHPVLATFDTANGNVITGSTSQFNQMFSDPDGHSLSYSKAGGNSVRTPGSSFSGPDSAFSINGGQWRFEIPSDAVNAVDGTIIEYQVYVTANDGQSKCNTEDSYFRIRVEGSGDIPPTNTPPPTSTPDDSGGIGPGGGLGG